MNTLGFTITAVFVLAMLLLPRRWALLTGIAGVMFLPQTQNVLILGFNTTGLRMIEVAGFLRVAMRRELQACRFNRVDKTFLLLYAYGTIVFLLRSRENQAYAIGEAVDATLWYFTFRALITGPEDVVRFLRDMVFLLVPYAAMVLLESLTGHTPFTALGMESSGWTRGGRPRCFGSFRNPTLLGTFAASFLALYGALWLGRVKRGFVAVAGLACLFIIWASNSGGSISCLGLVVVGWALWPLRWRMKQFQIGLLACLVGLASVMKAPIYALPTKVSSFTGGTGWHRTHLMDMAIDHFGKWWLAGMPERDTADWFPYGLSADIAGSDICNAYVMQAVHGGLGALILFIAVIVLAFGSVGRATRLAAGPDGSPTVNQYLLWGLGVTLNAHVFAWLGDTYFDQTKVYYFMQLACLSSLSTFYLAPAQTGPQRPAPGEPAMGTSTPQTAPVSTG